LLEHGAIDMIVHRTEMRDTLARLLAKLGNLQPTVADVKAEPVEPPAGEEPGQLDESATPQSPAQGDE